MPLEKGSLLNNRYTITDTIASGGMGAIYRAIDEILGIAVAVKENFFSTEEFLRQFRREATILAGLRHPNLPRVTDHFVITGHGQYLVMDFIEGYDLRDIIARQGALPEDDVVRIGVAICGAIEYLHSRNPAIVHRDIKPGNIKITPTGQVFLVDFGLAKLSRGEATTIGAQALTPGYAPPEQYGQGTEPRSDLYALGATLYALLTGKVPEDGLSRIMGSIELTPIRKYNPLVSTTVARVIEHAMAVKLNSRFQNAGSFKKELLTAAPQVNPNHPVNLNRTHPSTAPFPTQTPFRQAAIAEAAEPTARTPSDKELPGKQQPAQQFPVKKNRTPFITVFMGLLGISILTALAVLLLILPGLRKTNKASIPTTSIAAENTIVPLQVTPSKPPFTPTTTQPPSATQTVKLTTIPSDTPLPLPTTTEAPVSISTSLPVPAATLNGGGPGEIAFSSDRGGSVQIWLIDINGANARQITHLADGACQPGWAPDGKRLVFISPCIGKKEDYAGSSLYLINFDGTGLVPLASLPGGDFDPAWSPDGSRIAFTSLRDNGVPHIYLYNLTDNSTTRLSRVVNYERQPAWSPDGKWLAYQTTRLGEPQIWIMTPAGENAQEFSSLPGSFEWMPVWAPDGSILVYSQGSPSRLVARQIGDKSAKEFPISDKIHPAESADFSPDGWWLVFETKQDNNLDIYLISKNGSNLTRLTDNPGLDFQPSWSPSHQS